MVFFCRSDANLQYKVCYTSDLFGNAVTYGGSNDRAADR